MRRDQRATASGVFAIHDALQDFAAGRRPMQPLAISFGGTIDVAALGTFAPTRRGVQLSGLGRTTTAILAP